MTTSSESPAWIRIKLPDMGPSIDDASIGQWLVEPGDEVSEGQSIVELETDKVNTELAAESAGHFVGAVFETGELVTPGTTIALLVEQLGGTDEAFEAEKAAIRQRAPRPRRRTVRRQSLDSDALESGSPSKDRPSMLRFGGEALVIWVCLFLAMESGNPMLMAAVAAGLTLMMLSDRYL